MTATDLRVIEELIDEGVRVDCWPLLVDDDLWAIHGSIPVDGDVILAEFNSRDAAEVALARIAAAQRLI